MTELFNDYDELDAWLDTITTLEDFWKRTSIFSFPVPADEDETRADIIAGNVTEETALYVLKGIARSFIGQDMKLKYNIYEPESRCLH